MKHKNCVLKMNVTSLKVEILLILVTVFITFDFTNSSCIDELNTTFSGVSEKKPANFVNHIFKEIVYTKVSNNVKRYINYLYKGVTIKRTKLGVSKTHNPRSFCDKTVGTLTGDKRDACLNAFRKIGLKMNDTAASMKKAYYQLTINSSEGVVKSYLEHLIENHSFNRKVCKKRGTPEKFCKALEKKNSKTSNSNNQSEKVLDEKIVAPVPIYQPSNDDANDQSDDDNDNQTENGVSDTPPEDSDDKPVDSDSDDKPVDSDSDDKPVDSDSDHQHVNPHHDDHHSITDLDDQPDDSDPDDEPDDEDDED